jgi:pyruvate ferredoxin oxidoreductase alpha subunit
MSIFQSKKKYQALTGNGAAAEAIRQINPDVVAAYPITPQTEIVENFAQFVADGKVSTEFIRVESEHSALSAAVGASAAGARTMTATSSQGLALMHEILFVASGLRLPIVMPVVNRALSAPINIHCDHSDSMAERDSGWIQIYCENAQEVYDNTLIALKLAEDKEILLPAMICQDGFIISHAVANVLTLKDQEARKFIGEYKPENPLLNISNPITIGPLCLTDSYFEVKYQQIEAMSRVFKTFKKINQEFKKLTGRKYNFFEEYKMNGAEKAIIVLGSTAGTAKAAVDELRKKGEKIGLIKLRLFRPFPEKEIIQALKNVQAIAVLDRAVSFGAYGPVFIEIRSALQNFKKKKIKIFNYIYGLGGRDITVGDIKKVFEDLERGKNKERLNFIGLKK